MPLYDRYFDRHRSPAARSGSRDRRRRRRLAGTLARLFRQERHDLRHRHQSGLRRLRRRGRQSCPHRLAGRSGIPSRRGRGDGRRRHRRSTTAATWRPTCAASFDTLFPLLAEDGLYVAEDLHTAYWRNARRRLWVEAQLHRPGEDADRRHAPLVSSDGRAIAAGRATSPASMSTIPSPSSKSGTCRSRSPASGAPANRWNGNSHGRAHAPQELAHHPGQDLAEAGGRDAICANSASTAAIPDDGAEPAHRHLFRRHRRLRADGARRADLDQEQDRPDADAAPLLPRGHLRLLRHEHRRRATRSPAPRAWTRSRAR